MKSVFQFPTLIYFGPKVRTEIGSFLKSKNVKRPLLVTDKGIAALPFFKEMLGILNQSGLQASAFSDIVGNPVKSQVIRGLEAYKSHKADSIVGLGGGAALDVAKAIALMVNHPGDLFDYEDEMPGVRPIDKEIPYWIALPTTSGTGSEVGRSAVISDDKTHIKKIIFSPKLLAQAVFADPELTYDLPAHVTAATGMDALTHCVEAYLAKNFHPICDGIALEGTRLSAQYLARAVKKPHDSEARSFMMLSSMMGAIAFQKGLGVTHSCAHALSTVADFHHGLANGIMIPYALKINVSAVPERFERLAQVAGLKKQNGDGFMNWLSELTKEIEIPQKLSQKGIQKSQLPELCQVAMKDSCHSNNPRPVSMKDFETIFSEAY